MVVYFIKSVFGPELRRILKQNQQPGRNYVANNLEYFSNYVISIFHGFCVLCKWTSPVILAFAYYRGYLSVDGLASLCNMALVFGSMLGAAYVTRAMGRMQNKEYQEFFKLYESVNRNAREHLSERKQLLSKYDFQLKNWTPDFVSSAVPPVYKNEPLNVFEGSPLRVFRNLIWTALGQLCVGTFGLRMMYPGVIIQNLIGPALVEGRCRFIEQKQAKRAIVQTNGKHKNKIDTLFVDQRNVVRYSPQSSSKFATLDQLGHRGLQSNENNGNYLVICCDGNASFYEVGIFQLPIENGYSTLGWNYPGFGESTGLPYPEQTTAAADAVMQYAISSLGFQVENIILFSWSIGGFAVSWLSNHYPNLKAVILDACFDDITPLAKQQMPKFATNFVDFTIRHNLNLKVADYISRYSGPLMYIRRTQDEIISTIPTVAAANRGNDLLISTLSKRYPFIVDEETLPFIRTWLSAKSDSDRARILSTYSEDVSLSESILSAYVDKYSSRYPLKLGAKSSDDDDSSDDSSNLISKSVKLTLALYLADKYLLNFESSHCQPLPKSYFVMPWSEQELISRKTYSF